MGSWAADPACCISRRRRQCRALGEHHNYRDYHPTELETQTVNILQAQFCDRMVLLDVMWMVDTRFQDVAGKAQVGKVSYTCFGSAITLMLI